MGDCCTILLHDAYVTQMHGMVYAVGVCVYCPCVCVLCLRASDSSMLEFVRYTNFLIIIIIILYQNS